MEILGNYTPDNGQQYKKAVLSVAEEQRQKSAKIFDSYFTDFVYQDSPVAAKIPAILEKIKKMVNAKDVIPEVDFREVVKEIFEEDKKIATDIYQRACDAYKSASTEFIEGNGVIGQSNRHKDLSQYDGKWD
jgi:hypothetical protein